MYFLYNTLVYITGFLLKVLAFFNNKIKLFTQGRKRTFKDLKTRANDARPVLWFHCASLGEFEQGRPIIEASKKAFSNHQILVTFFSPSGYEIRKDYNEADLVTYLPLDTKANAKRFVKMVNPALAVFIKYEFWPNILKELQLNEVKTILVSGIFRKEQAFFKWHGAWIRKSLAAFDHFFVQDVSSKALLNAIDIDRVSVNGDTRFDRVFEITTQEHQLEILEKFVAQKPVLVAGSTWDKGETLLIDYINGQKEHGRKFIIAPHTINQKEIARLRASFVSKAVLFSEAAGKDLGEATTLIIDTIGILTKIYSYADIAYVGGGFGSGIHNILEPATYGVPIVIGPNYQKFKEAKDLVKKGTCIVVKNSEEFNHQVSHLFSHDQDRIQKGINAKKYILDNIGATEKVMDFMREIL